MDAGVFPLNMCSPALDEAGTCASGLQLKERSSRVVLLGIAMLTTFVLGEIGLAGCNAILGNEAGILGLEGSTESGISCPAGQKSCAGSCVAVNDPAVGCSGECTACASPPNGQPGCALANDTYSCAIDKCNAQYDNCDDSGANGCETHITTRAHCGSCNGSCSQQFCERQGDSYVCSDSCDAPNISCGVDGGVVDCIDPKSDNANWRGLRKRMHGHQRHQHLPRRRLQHAGLQHELLSGATTSAKPRPRRRAVLRARGAQPEPSATLRSATKTTALA